MKGRHWCCAGDGGRLGRVFLAAVKRSPQLPPWEQFEGATVVATYLGRVAALRMCRELGLGRGDEILAPSYNCGSEIDPLVVSGATVTLYRVGRDARIDVEDIMTRATERTRAVYVTHYFGWPQPLTGLSAWCRKKGVFLIEDCAPALFSRDDYGPLGTMGDAALFSLRKFLPVPDGGVLRLRREVSAEEMRSPPIGTTLRNMLPLLKSQCLRGLERLGLYSPLRTALLRKHRRDPAAPAAGGLPDIPAAYYFDVRIQDWSMSSLARGIAMRTDSAAVVERRRANYQALHEMTQGLPHVEHLFRDLPAGVCPLAMPVLTRQRDAIVVRLNAQGIGAFPFWKGYHRGFDLSGFPETRYLKDHLLALPVHQALTHAHMAYIAQEFADAVTSLAADGRA
jgi:perosamine synthetase